MVVNAHREGLLLIPTLRSVQRAAVEATKSGSDVEIVIVLDRSTAATTEVAREFASSAKIVPTEFGDLGLARNAGIAAARGDWVALIDGDDLWGQSWLLRALEAATKDDRKVVWHPQYSVYFENEEHIYEHIDSEDPDFDVNFLLTRNYWTSAAFAKRSAFSETPYLEADRQSMFGYEDWNWNCRTIEAGYLHKIAKGTAHFIRRRNSSMSRSMLSDNAMCIPHTLFRSTRLGSSE